MKALVTGATGFVGSHLVERLLQEGLEVVCLARSSSSRSWIENLSVGVRLADLGDRASLALAIADVDYIFHVAGLTRARTPGAYLAVNTEGTRRLIEAAVRAERPIRRFVYISSLAAVGPAPTESPVDETNPPHPLDGYGRSKLAAERIVLEHADCLPVTIVRPPAVYGPRDTNLLPVFRLAARWRLAPLIGRPNKQVSFAYARDLAEGICQAGLKEAGLGQTYFVASGTHSMEEFADALSEAMGTHLQKLPIPAWLARLTGEWGELKWKLTGKPQIVSRRKIRDSLQDRWTCSWDKARRELGYREKTTLCQGLAETVQWYRHQGWIPPAQPRSRRSGGSASHHP